MLSLLTTALCLGGIAQTAEETRTTVYVYDASGQVVREIVEPFTTRLCVATEYTYDGYGNPSTAQPRNCNGTAYNGRGKLHRKSAPYFAGDAADSVPWANFSIDVTDRVEYQTQPHPAASLNGTTTAISYIGQQTTQTVQVLNTTTTTATANSTQTAQARTETRNAVDQAWLC